MVSRIPRRGRPRARPGAPSTRARLLAAAAEEFAQRGFDGAKVDRLARRARVNKAMLYYHFGSKAALYQAVLAEVFQTIAAHTRAARAEGGAPDEQLRRFIRVIAAVTETQPNFPAIWLREMAEGGRHLTPAIGAELADVLGTLVAILEPARRDGRFRAVPPIVIQMGIVAPLLLFAASEPLRRRLDGQLPGAAAAGPIAALPRHVLVDYVETATLLALHTGAGDEPLKRGRK